jgi:hypothetical protein
VWRDLGGEEGGEDEEDDDEQAGEGGFVAPQEAGDVAQAGGEGGFGELLVEGGGGGVSHFFCRELQKWRVFCHEWHEWGESYCFGIDDILVFRRQGFLPRTSQFS